MMHETYTILIDNVPMARAMTLETAIILIKGLFQEYYNDDELKIVIAREAGPDTESTPSDDWKTELKALPNFTP